MSQPLHSKATPTPAAQNLRHIKNGVDLYLKANKTEESLDCFREVLRLDLDYDAAWSNLGDRPAQAEGKFEAAADLFAACAGAVPDKSRVPHQLRQLPRRYGPHPEEAVELYTEALRLTPGDAALRYKFAIILRDAVRLEEA